MTEEANRYNRLKIVYSINDVGKIGQIRAKKNETRPPSYAIPKNKLKMDYRLKCKSQNHKIIEENIGSKISDSFCSNILAAISPRSKETKEKNQQMGAH